ncbi:MAG: UDP-N-acetylmuramate--L-alanine ligase [Anaerolineales bacterium]
MDPILIPGQHIHIVGMGGFGMSAIARVLLEDGYTVSGSDRERNALLDALERDGVQVFMGHAPEHITGAELVLMSSAIPKDNPEIQAARAASIPVQERRDFIATWLENRSVIGVSGTHGKTTTTALLAHVLMHSGHDPSYIVGGILKNTGTNAGAGNGEHFIIEADEYGYMFLGLQPHIAVVTNVEWDHTDFFRAPEDMLLAFRLYMERLEPDGLLVACLDDDVAASLAAERRAVMRSVQTYSLGNPRADWWAVDLEPARGGLRFSVCHGATRGGIIGQAWLPMPGRYNVSNAMAVIAVAMHLGVPFTVITEALASFAGTGRRAELMGEAAGVRVINDYAHHPTAIAAALRAWREQNPGRLWAVWQPHTYSRSRTLAGSFAGAFGAADYALVTDIYAAREVATPGILAPDLAKLIQQTGHPDARYSGDLFATAQVLSQEVRAGDVVLIMSAGDAPLIGRALLEVLRKREGFADG